MMVKIWRLFKKGGEFLRNRQIVKEGWECGQIVEEKQTFFMDDTHKV